MSGSLRSTLDVFDEYQDAEIVCSCLRLSCHPFISLTQFEALRRVHLIPSEDTPDDDINENVFRNLDSLVSEGGENFSTGSVEFDSCLCKFDCFVVKSSYCVWREQS